MPIAKRQHQRRKLWGGMRRKGKDKDMQLERIAEMAMARGRGGDAAEETEGNAKRGKAASPSHLQNHPNRW